LTEEKDNAQKHGNAQCPLKIGEELGRPTKSASDDSKTDPGINNYEMLKNLQFFKFFISSKHLVMAPNLGFNYYHLQNENKESSADIEV
jgi:hypothetical protein